MGAKPGRGVFGEDRRGYLQRKGAFLKCIY